MSSDLQRVRSHSNVSIDSLVGAPAHDPSSNGVRDVHLSQSLPINQSQNSQQDNTPRRQPQGLRHRNVRKSGRNWGKMAQITAGCTLKGAIMGAAFGAAGGLPGMALGAIIGGVVGAVGGAQLAKGVDNGTKFHTRRAVNIGPRAMSNKYAVGSDRFNRAIDAHNKRVIRQNPNLSPDHRDVPENISESDKRQIEQNFRKILEARKAVGDPVDKRFLDRTIVKLTKIQTDPNLNAQEKSKLNDHLENVLTSYEAAGKSVKPEVIDSAFATAKFMLAPIESRDGLDDDEQDAIEEELSDLVRSTTTAGRSLKTDVLKQVSESMAGICNNDNLDEDEAELVRGKLIELVKYANEKNNKLLDSDFVKGAAEGLSEIVASGLEEDVTGRMINDFMTRLKAGFEKEKGKPRNWKMTKPTGKAIGKGMVKIADSDLRVTLQAVAFKSFDVMINAERRMNRPLSEQKVKKFAKACVTTEEVLDGMDEELTDSQRANVKRTMRKLVQKRVLTGQPTNRAALKQLRDDVITRVQGTGDEDEFNFDANRVRDLNDLNYSANQDAGWFVDQLVNSNATEEDLLETLADTNLSARQYKLALHQSGFKDDGQRRVDSTGQRVRGGPISEHGHKQAFKKRFSEALDAKNLTPQQAAQHYNRLMGTGGKFRTMLFAKQLMMNDPRIANHPDSADSFNALFAGGMEIVLEVLAAKANLPANKVSQDLAEIKQKAHTLSSPDAKVDSFLDTKLDPKLIRERDSIRQAMSNSQNNGNQQMSPDLLRRQITLNQSISRDKRAKSHQLRNTQQYQDAANFRYDVNETNISDQDLTDAGINSQNDLLAAKRAIHKNGEYFMTGVLDLKEKVASHQERLDGQN